MNIRNLRHIEIEAECWETNYEKGRSRKRTVLPPPNPLPRISLFVESDLGKLKPLGSTTKDAP